MVCEKCKEHIKIVGCVGCSYLRHQCPGYFYTADVKTCKSCKTITAILQYVGKENRERIEKYLNDRGYID